MDKINLINLINLISNLKETSSAYQAPNPKFQNFGKLGNWKFFRSIRVIRPIRNSAGFSDAKRFIAEFDFPSPDWTSLPAGFPIIDKSGLTKEERHILDGINLAWAVSDGRETLYKTTAKRVFVGIAIVVLVLLGGSLLVRPEKSITKSVSAKTVSQSVEEFVEATMSAVFKRQN